MKPSDLVPDLDTCQRLKAAGFEQGTLLVWVGPETTLRDDFEVHERRFAGLMTGLDEDDGDMLTAAPTLQEMLNMLGVFINPMPPKPSLRAVTRIIDAKNSSQEAALLWLELNEDTDETT